MKKNETGKNITHTHTYCGDGNKSEIKTKFGTKYGKQEYRNPKN
jgi:hypothetical protein